MKSLALVPAFAAVFTLSFSPAHAGSIRASGAMPVKGVYAKNLKRSSPGGGVSSATSDSADTAAVIGTGALILSVPVIMITQNKNRTSSTGS